MTKSITEKIVHIQNELDDVFDEYKVEEEVLNQEIKASQQNALKASRLIFEKRRLLSKNKKLQEQLDEAKTENNNLLNDIVDLNLTIQHKEEQLKEANKLLLDFCSEDECRFDHNGYCQEHDSCEGGYKCIQKDLKQYLKKWGVK